ncbi:hypothetical protein PV11_09036 [Exophiala sideris]|uniref:Tautomerase cis-CaaD-like domain-containing protein n=1 Tax=Exophiala sideris TaxID=1016849 RepID=A0A0D1WQ64_9EURO|nr:hypothetical protein PV11_09036 [Exophiala sideris]
MSDTDSDNGSDNYSDNDILEAIRKDETVLYQLAPRFIFTPSSAAVSAPTSTTETSDKGEAEMEKDTSYTHSKGQPEEQWEEHCDKDDDDTSDTSSLSASRPLSRSPSLMSCTSTPSSAPSSPTIDAQRPAATIAQISPTTVALLQPVRSGHARLERQIADIDQGLTESDRRLAEIDRRLTDCDGQLAEFERRLIEIDRQYTEELAEIKRQLTKILRHHAAEIKRQHAEIECQNAVIERQHCWAQTGDREPEGRDQRTATIQHTIPLTAAQKHAIAQAITSLHSTTFVTPSLFVNVVFQQLKNSDDDDPTYFLAGEPTSTPNGPNRILALVRSSPARSKQTFDDLAVKIENAWYDAIGDSHDKQAKKMHFIAFYPMIAVRENGVAIPDAGKEGTWLKENMPYFKSQAYEHDDEEFKKMIEEVNQRDDLKALLS